MTICGLAVILTFDLLTSERITNQRCITEYIIGSRCDHDFLQYDTFIFTLFFLFFFSVLNAASVRYLFYYENRARVHKNKHTVKINWYIKTQ